MLAAAMCRRSRAFCAGSFNRLGVPIPRQPERSFSSQPTSSEGVPVLDLAARDEELVPDIAAACSQWGFFQVVNHGVDDDICRRFRQQMMAFFDLPHSTKSSLRRTADNARGFFDDELTKQRRDWKQALDLGVPGSRDWSTPDFHPGNACLDGYNRLPDEATLPDFRPTMVEYFRQVTTLSERLAALFSEGLGMPPNFFDEHLRNSHSSYLRMNYYPPAINVEPGTLGISPHRDAGFLTVLEQDLDCHSLQVARLSDGEWFTVVPLAGALTINTGDMAQMWSNGRYQAPLHRVLTNGSKKRWSAPYFYNPGYRTSVKPLPTLGEPSFEECYWGYFRAQRFAGDMADFGTEIQTSDYQVGSCSPHLERQRDFISRADFSRPFNIDEYRPLLEMN